MVSCVCGVETRVGLRVAVGKNHGTVRYEGEVPPAKGTWLGVEWDDPTRGKHNGVYNNVRYFHTSHPTSGSLIRVEKADFGRSCVSAIRERYGSNQLTLTAAELADLQRAMNAPSLEMVGFEKINQKQSCFASLQVVCLHDHQVSSVGDSLADMCPNTVDLDLSFNLLVSWTQVAEITQNFPHLRFFNLSYNRLELPEEPERLKVAFKNLFHVVLAHLAYTWDQICTCSEMWPQIEVLQVPFNNITTLNLPVNTLENLTSLDLEGNVIQRWEEINKLGILEKLESLNICDTGLTNICLPPGRTLFKSLQCLLLSDNSIDRWEYVSELDKLPQLGELRFTHNPVLYNLSIAAIHYKTICRISSLKVLNREKISREERRGAEMEYLKEFGMGWLEAAKNKELKENFLSKHPRYPFLVKKYGAPEESEMEVKSSSLTSSLVRVTLRSETQAVTKTLPKTMQLARLTLLIKRLFNTGDVEHSLYYRSTQNANSEIKMDNLFKSLDYYSIEDGDEIIVKW